MVVMQLMASTVFLVVVAVVDMPASSMLVHHVFVVHLVLMRMWGFAVRNNGRMFVFHTFFPLVWPFTWIECSPKPLWPFFRPTEP